MSGTGMIGENLPIFFLKKCIVNKPAGKSGFSSEVTTRG
jgi:hypothetical protein